MSKQKNGSWNPWFSSMLVVVSSIWLGGYNHCSLPQIAADVDWSVLICLRRVSPHDCVHCGYHQTIYMVATLVVHRPDYIRPSGKKGRALFIRQMGCSHLTVVRAPGCFDENPYAKLVFLDPLMRILIPKSFFLVSVDSLGPVWRTWHGETSYL